MGRRGVRVRPLTVVPLVVWLVLGVALTLQIAWHARQPAPVARAADLPHPPSLELLRVAALGEEAALAGVLNLWLQAFDYQSGVSLSFRELDYPRVVAWLGRILELDPRGQYPLISASRLYGELPVPEKSRLMLDFVREKFEEDPNRRWPWLAHAAILARHRLDDKATALAYARAIAQRATGPHVPVWAKQLSIPFLEDLNELESARFLVGGLLESGTVTHPQEINFLAGRLEEIEAKLGQKTK